MLSYAVFKPYLMRSVKLISVCMATYNGEKFVADQIKSILNQIDVDDELIISDDNSTDSTVKIIQQFDDSRIKLVKNLKGGIVNNFENSLKNARGDFIFLSDQDDVWRSNKIKVVVSYLRNDYDLIVHNATVTNANLKSSGESLFGHYNSRPGFIINLYKNNFVGCCMAFRREILDVCMPFPSYLPMHDSWIGLISTLRWRVGFIDDELIYHRRHNFNSSTTGATSGSSFFKKITDRFNLLFFSILRVLSKWNI